MSSLGQLTHTRRTDGAPEPDGALRTVTRAKIHHYRQLYINRPEPIAFMPVAETRTAVSTRILVANEIPEESEQFRFLRAACLLILRGQWG
jgi:hypothetical protein